MTTTLTSRAPRRARRLAIAVAALGAVALAVPAAAHADLPIADNAVYTCEGKNATIVGTNAANVIVGTPFSDVIVGLGGNDIIYGLDGNDVICGGAGNDYINPGLGRDVVRGGWGNDLIVATDGQADLVHGDVGVDACPTDAVDLVFTCP